MHPLINNKQTFDTLSSYTNDAKLYFNVYKDSAGIWHNSKESADAVKGKDTLYRINVKFKIHK